MFKLVILDWIGIISGHENEYSLFKKITGFKGTAQSLKAHIGDSYDKLIMGESTESAFWNKLIKESKTRRKTENVKKDFFKSLNPVISPDLLKKAKGNFKFAICANFYHKWHDTIKKKYGLEFDYESFSSKTKMKKESKETYLNAMINFKLKPHQCIVASDEINDLRLAKELGMKALLIIGKSKESKDADYTYEKFDDFLKALI